MFSTYSQNNLLTTFKVKYLQFVEAGELGCRRESTGQLLHEVSVLYCDGGIFAKCPLSAKQQCPIEMKPSGFYSWHLQTLMYHNLRCHKIQRPRGCSACLPKKGVRTAFDIRQRALFVRLWAWTSVNWPTCVSCISVRQAASTLRKHNGATRLILPENKGQVDALRWTRWHLRRYFECRKSDNAHIFSG